MTLLLLISYTKLLFCNSHGLDEIKTLRAGISAAAAFDAVHDVKLFAFVEHIFTEIKIYIVRHKPHRAGVDAFAASYAVVVFRRVVAFVITER